MLEANEIIELLNKGVSEDITNASYHDSRLRMHTIATDKKPIEDAFNDWYGRQKKKIDTDSYGVFDAVLAENYPLPTVPFTNSLFSELSKVFEANDRNIHAIVDAKGGKKAEKKELEDILNKVDSFIKVKGFEATKNAINAVVVSDTRLMGDVLETFSFLVYSDSFRLLSKNNDNSVNYFAWQSGELEGNKIVSYVDDAFYRTFIQTNDGFKVHNPERAHDIEKTPCEPVGHQFRDESRDYINMSGVISQSISRIDGLLCQYIGQDNNDLHCLYPNIWRYEKEGDYKEETLDNETLDSGLIEDLPINNNKPFDTDIVGGANIIVKWPMEGEQPVGDVIGFNSPAVETLKHIEEHIENSKDYIKNSCIGVKGESSTDQAKNEKQVQSGFESQQAVSDRYKANVERLHKGVLINELLLKYGKSYDISVNVSYGRNIFFHTSEELEKRYLDNKKAGMPVYVLSQTRKELLDDKYKENPITRARLKILDSIDPHPSYSSEDCIAKADYLDEESVILKVNFENFVNRFENEQGQIDEFLESMPYSKALKHISETIKSYLKDVKPRKNKDEVQNNDGKIKGADK